MVKAGALAVPVFRKKNVLPHCSPTKASRSPSPSMSAKAGDANSGQLASPKGWVEGAAKAGALAVPVFAKRIVSP
jgi:hypothetical protein